METEKIAAMESRNRQIIDAVITKAERICPGVLAMIGIYGSFATGDIHGKSDLDLMIVINDDTGWQLADGFLADGIGYDIYCTTWESLEREAEYESPYISKLMDSHIVYCADEKYQERLEGLRRQAAEILAAPFSEKDYKRAEGALRRAQLACYRLDHMTAEEAAGESAGKTVVEAGAGQTVAEEAEKALGKVIGEARGFLAEILYEVENAVCLLNKQYFHLGVKRVFEELEEMRHRPDNMRELCEKAVTAATVPEMCQAAGKLLSAVEACFGIVREELLTKERQQPTVENLRGTYEEMFSNWRNKMYEAADRGDVHASFMAMASFQLMLDEMAEAVELEHFEALGSFRPDNLWESAAAYDRVLAEYRKVYDRVGLPVQEFGSTEEFVKKYLKMP